MSIKPVAWVVVVLGVLGCDSTSEPAGSALSSAQPQAAGSGGSAGPGAGGSGGGSGGSGGSAVAGSGGSEAAGAGVDPEAGGAGVGGAAGSGAGGHPHAGGPGEGGGGEGAVSFSKDVMPIFEKSCATCHQSGGYIHPYLGPQAQMSPGQVRDALLASEGFLGDRAVVPGSPETSWLIGKLTGEMSAFACAKEKACGGVMPAPQTDTPVDPLPQAQIDLIKAWVSQGAKDN